MAIQARVNEVAELIQVGELDEEGAAGLAESMSELRVVVLCILEATGRHASLLACIDQVVLTLSSLRPPKRRAGPCNSHQADRARRSHGRKQGNGG